VGIGPKPVIQYSPPGNFILGICLWFTNFFAYGFQIWAKSISNKSHRTAFSSFQILLVLIGIEGTNMDLRHISSQLLNEQQA